MAVMSRNRFSTYVTVAFLCAGVFVLRSQAFSEGSARLAHTSGSGELTDPKVLRRALDGTATRSFYAHWVTADPEETADIADRRGCAEGKRDHAGVIALAFGRQFVSGASGFSRSARPYEVLEAAAEGYARGLARCGKGPYLLALATSNHRTTDRDGATDGRAWAEMVSRTRQRVTDIGDTVVIAGGNDIEPSWGPARYAVTWVEGFAASGLPYVFIGSADGCPWRDGQAGCNNGWTPQQVAYVAWPSDVSFPLPQVYDHKGRMAAQWARLSRIAGRPLLGVLVQRAACRVSDDSSCPQLDISSRTALRQLNEHLAKNIKVSSDITWE
jgi:hypothetical protein